MRNLLILGSTGSIGQNTLRVARSLPEHFKISGLAAYAQDTAILQQAQEFKVPRIALAEPAAAQRAKAGAPPELEVLEGSQGLLQLIEKSEADLVLLAVVGMAGLPLVLRALELGMDVALATKEALVVAGRQVMEAAKKAKARILPVDSEHSAIFQCLEGRSATHLRKLILTASGGPFYNQLEQDLNNVTVADALNHPRWSMGRKISVDSATMMNKGLEIMEARWLFDVELEQIEVMLHPESVIHSMVEFQDGSLMAQLSPTDMRYAIQYALTWPQRLNTQLPPLDLAEIGTLHFSRPDTKRFPCLTLARDAAQAGGTMPTVLNAANEVAVEAFLAKRLPFAGIWRVVEQTMLKHQTLSCPSLEEILMIDNWARQTAWTLVKD